MKIQVNSKIGDLRQIFLIINNYVNKEMLIKKNQPVPVIEHIIENCDQSFMAYLIDISERELVQVSFVVLLFLIGTIPVSGITQSFADKGEIPDWVKTTLALWTNGEITNEEFVRAIDYLTERGIVEISSTNDKEVQRQIEYLKAKSEVFQEETKDLREENKEYRILLKSQEINKSEKFPTSMSKIFDSIKHYKLK